MKPIRPVAAVLIMSVLAAVYLLWQQAPARPAPPRPPKAARAPALAPRYTARDLLATSLALQSLQVRRLEALARTWDEERRPLERSLAMAQGEFEEFMADATRGNRVRLDDVQARSVELRQLSAELREARAAHEVAAVAVLTPEQRAALSRRPATTGGGR
jgi:Spy/CpxP family protein refolding chaperone